MNIMIGSICPPLDLEMDQTQIWVQVMTQGPISFLRPPDTIEGGGKKGSKKGKNYGWKWKCEEHGRFSLCTL